MWTALFMILLIAVFGKVLIFALKAAWGITKILFTVVFLPVILVGLVIGGLLSIAFPLLVVAGIILLVLTARRV